jgi:hypothetical protein
LAASYLAAFPRRGRGGVIFQKKDFSLKKKQKLSVLGARAGRAMLRSVTRLCAGATF